MSFSLLAIELKDALKEEGCAVCRLVQENDKRHIRHFLWEGKSEGHMLLRLKQSLGLCHHHAWLLAEMECQEEKDALGTATLHDWLLDITSDALHQAPRAVSIQAAKRLAGLLEAEERCPLCDTRQAFEETTLWGLQQFLASTGGNETVRNLYAKSGGLCFPHLRAMLRLTPFSEVVQLLVQVETRAIDSLLEELELFQRKHRIDELASIEKEGDAWGRALDLLAGRIGGFTPPDAGKAADESHIAARG